MPEEPESSAASKLPRWVIWVAVLVGVNVASWYFDLGFTLW